MVDFLYGNFKPTYVNCTPHWGNRTEEYYLSGEEYLKVINFIKAMKMNKKVKELKK